MEVNYLALNKLLNGSITKKEYEMIKKKVAQDEPEIGLDEPAAEQSKLTMISIGGGIVILKAGCLPICFWPDGEAESLPDMQRVVFGIKER